MDGENGEKERRRERVVYDSFINEKKRRKIMEELTERIDDLQDESVGRTVLFHRADSAASGT